MAYIERNGVKIFYQVFSDAEQSTQNQRPDQPRQEGGPPVLLSHGYSATSEMWNGQVKDLMTEFTVITWDMRGHGMSDSPDDPNAYSEEETVEDMRAILDDLGIDQAVIGGLSLGGYMSLAFYHKYPERTRALMLFDTGPGYRNDKGRDAWNQTAYARAEAFEQKGLEALGRSAEVVASSHRSAEGLAHAARGMLAQFGPHVIESLPNIKVPTLVLVGENDEPFLAATDYMANKIPNATRVVVPEAGHASNIDNPNVFNIEVRNFLETLKQDDESNGSSGRWGNRTVEETTAQQNTPKIVGDEA